MDTLAQRLGGKVGGYRLAATHNPLEYTKAARTAFERRFFEGLDPTLPPEEIARRAEAAKKAYFSEIALKRHRGAKKASKKAATP